MKDPLPDALPDDPDDVTWVAELLAALTVPDPGDDGIDRSDGFGTGLVVTGLAVEPGVHGDELVVTYDLDDEGAWRACVARLPFDREWRRLCGHDTPASHAPAVARAVVHAGGTAPWRDRVRHLDLTRLPPYEEQQRQLLWVLGQLAPVQELGAGRYEVDHHVVVVEPGDWAQVLALVGDDLWSVVDELRETLGSGPGAEDHVVLWEGDFHRSVRARLPPVPARPAWSSGAGLRWSPGKA